MDVSLWILFATAWLALTGYLTFRGLAKNEFRERGRWGWHRYRAYSFEWWGGTVVNLLFLGIGLFFFYQEFFHGSEFGREAIHPPPRISGEPTKTLHASGTAQQVALCIADLNHGQSYRFSDGRWRVAVWNGRGEDMYAFEIVDDAPGSRLDIYRSFMSPFVGWDRCLDGGGEPSDGIIAQSQD